MSDKRRDEINGRRPVGEVLAGLTVHALEEGDVAEEAFILMKTRDTEGVTSWSYRTTKPPNREELLGALLIQTDLLRRELLNEWESE